MNTLRLALDWTPNINHIGFYVAKELGYYRDIDIDLAITNPLDDNYTLTPAKKVELGEADFALCPTESIINLSSILKYSYLLRSNGMVFNGGFLRKETIGD